MINSSDISVVVQGAIDKIETPKCLKSIRDVLPDAEIILSTWEGSIVDGLDFDVLIFSEDPGNALLYKAKGNKKTYNNMNRQLLSTKEGLKKCSRKYTLKLRSDLILTTTGFLEYFDKFQARIDEYKLFERKIVISSLYTRYYLEYKKNNRKYMPFNFSDWYFFGLTEDLNTYFLDTPLVKEPEFTNYFNAPENIDKDNPFGKYAKFKFAPEQYFGYECFSRNYENIYMEDAADYTAETLQIFEKCLANNFIILEFEQSGIFLNKYPFSKQEMYMGDEYFGLYTFYRYEEAYKRICDNDYKITANKRVYENEKYGQDLIRVYKHIYNLSRRDLSFLKKLDEMFLGIPISMMSFVIKHCIINRVIGKK